MEKQSLLIEIGTEELPPKALQALSHAFAEGIFNGLEKAKLCPSAYKKYAAPRRLAVLLEQVPVMQAEQNITRRGPAIKAAFDDTGQPSKAATGFAHSCGVSVDELSRVKTDKGEWLSYSKTEAGRSTIDCLTEIIEKSLADLPIPKRMRWGDSDHEFVRPIHWVTIVFGSELVPLTIFGLQASNTTKGHRFHAPQALEINSAENYCDILKEKGFVIADADERKQAVEQQVRTEAKKLSAQPIINEDLLDEVTALVEWPISVVGSFEHKYLAIPSEALITTMQDHQKYFALLDSNGELMPNFITIANIESNDPDMVRKGNERVVRPRLADAEFFWTQDKKQPLQARLEILKSVVFQYKLGSVYEKTERIESLAVAIASNIGGDSEEAARAAKLSKCDLVTEMVGEFASLQGTMGKYYAKLDGENEEVSTALEEQYKPKFAGDSLPETISGQALALADRIDTLVGIFAIGQKPTGASDPFGLRRAALGVLRILIEKELDIDLHKLVSDAAKGLTSKVDAGPAVNEAFNYVMERLRAYYAEKSYKPQVVESVLASGVTVPLDFDRRVTAVDSFSRLPEASSLAAANKRIRNILKKIEGELPDAVNQQQLTEPAEKNLYEQLEILSKSVKPLFVDKRYEEGLLQLAKLRAPVDAFFDHVMVMVDDEALKHNRIALLNQLLSIFSEVADLSLLPTE